jgi:hypothetical protein
MKSFVVDESTKFSSPCKRWRQLISSKLCSNSWYPTATVCPKITSLRKASEVINKYTEYVATINGPRCRPEKRDGRKVWDKNVDVQMQGKMYKYKYNSSLQMQGKMQWKILKGQMQGKMHPRGRSHEISEYRRLNGRHAPVRETSEQRLQSLWSVLLTINKYYCKQTNI